MQTEIEASEVDGNKSAHQTGASNNEASQAAGVKRKKDDDDDDDFSHDEVRLWEDGFKERYYESKFAVPPTDEDFRSKVALEYVRGLCWVLQYYYQVNRLEHSLGLFDSAVQYIYIYFAGCPIMEVVFSISLCSICFRFPRYFISENYFRKGHKACKLAIL